MASAKSDEDAMLLIDMVNGHHFEKGRRREKNSGEGSIITRIEKYKVFFGYK